MTEDLRSPLKWPMSKPRTAPHERKRAPFGREPNHAPTVYRARLQLEHELRRLGVRDVVISTNLALRLDGEPRSGQPEPQDPGVAVYFDLGKRATVLACDKWDRVADNLRAIVKHIDALRGQERWGVGSIEQAFAGYAALPAPGQHSRRPWRAVLEYPSSLEEAESRFRSLARVHHPDAGGDAAHFAELTEARDQARKELAA
jgi:hypothetical protein